MGGTAILVVEVVGMLPDVEGEDGFEAVGDGVVCVGVLANGQFAFVIGLKPDPAATEKAYAFGFEVGLEGVEGAPLLFKLLSKIPGQAGNDGRSRQ